MEIIQNNIRVYVKLMQKWTYRTNRNNAKLNKSLCVRVI